MSERWKVTYRFSDNVHVRNPIESYENLGVSLKYDGNKLTCVVHELDCDDSSESSKVIDKSKEALKLFWEVLRYWRGTPLNYIPSATRVAGNLPPKSTGICDVSASILISAPIIMPKSGLFSKAPDRLLVWLKLMNDAFDSDDAAYEIRNYYMIWEDMNSGLNKAKWPIDAKELKLVRDFVSHGKELGNPEIQKLIKRELGQLVKQFDPTDKAHQDFVKAHCKSARSLVEKDLEKKLNQI